MSKALSLNDIELVDTFIEQCRDFISPLLLRDIESRGLYNIINRLPNNISEAKAVARARLAKAGYYIGDPEIEQIAAWVKRLEHLRYLLSNLNLADADKTFPVIEEMATITQNLKDYYK